MIQPAIRQQGFYEVDSLPIDRYDISIFGLTMAHSIQGKNPFGAGDVEFKISDKKIENTRYEPDHKFCELVYVLALVMKEPSAIFRGLKREGYERGLCFSGKTSRYWRNRTTETPFPPGKVFCIYVDDNGFIFEWRLDRE